MAKEAPAGRREDRSRLGVLAHTTYMGLGFHCDGHDHHSPAGCRQGNPGSVRQNESLGLTQRRGGAAGQRIWGFPKKVVVVTAASI